MAASEAGLTLQDFLELDAEECDAWRRFVFEGASKFRDHLLIVQLIQIVGGALGAKNLTPEKMLPYLSTLYPEDPQAKKKAMLARQRAVSESLLDFHLPKEP